MRVLLIAPPWLDIYGDYKAAAKLGCVGAPLGLMYLGAAVMAHDAECRIVDMESQGVDSPALLDIIRAYKPNIIGITATTPVFKNATILGEAIKKAFPQIPLGIGGVHSTVIGKEILETCPSFDFQIVGEGEFAIQEVIDAFRSGGGLAGVTGVIYREGDGIIENPRRPHLENLDDVPMPARHLLDPEMFQHCLPDKGFVRYAELFTSRGCPFQCVFCSQHTMYGRRVRWHSIERVVEELEYITQTLGVQHVIFMDETLTLNKPRLLDICSEIRKRGLQFTWEGWTHASTIDEELLRAMKEAGLIRLSFGIESGDPDILKGIKKGITLEQIREAYKIAAKVGIETRGSAMLGHPHETRETAWRTIKFIHSIKECMQIFLNVACPYPGTELYESAVNGRGGMKLLTRDYSQYKRYGDPVIEVNDLSSKDLKRLQRVGLLYFYLTPRRIWYNVVRRAGLRAGLVNGFAFLRGLLNSLISGKK